MKKLLSVALACLSLFSLSAVALADGWKTDPIWHDGLVEKAVYNATRVVYAHPRHYQMIIFTNKEQHDLKTDTKSDTSKDTVEVWKHNQIEDIPTPNYHYHYETTTHLDVNTLDLTRLDCSSQEFCGTSFKQYLRQFPAQSWSYWAFSYLPEQGRIQGTVTQSQHKVVAADSLPLYLRDFDFAGQGVQEVALLPDQTNNNNVKFEPVEAQIRFAGEDGDSYKLQVLANGKTLGTYWMAKDRLHVMTRYQGADGQTYELANVSRVNYWTRHEK
jgi:hypothetical protein